MSYNAIAVKNYNATSRLLYFENKNVFLCLEKCSMYTTTYNAGVVVVI
jgi:hypothetical protein